MKVKTDEDGFSSQRSAAALGCSQQYANSLARRGKVATKPDGAVALRDVVERLIESKMRQALSPEEFEKFRELRRIERLEAEHECLVRALPSKQAVKILGEQRYSEILKEIKDGDRAQ